jgi:serine/threonine protein kinase
MSTPSLPSIGDIVADKYRIDAQLGEGGMAVVFGAHHTLLDKPIAVKILSPDLPRLPEVIERFLTEARAAARVDSPNVARVMDVGLLVNGLPYMVMERLDGCDLEELLRLEKQLLIGDAVDYVLQALQGLAHAHALGVVHRDLKPANLFLAHQTDGTAIIKILDFGIARMDKTSRMTNAGQAVGSPTYMSPEHIRNSELLDHRTDIWAMGVVLYELLTGRPPIEAEGVGETLAAVLSKKPPSSCTLRPEIPAELDAAIMKCLEHDPAERWADVAQLARAIAPFGTGACAALPDSIENTLRQQLRRYSGQAIMVRPTPITAIPVVVSATSKTQDAPAVTEDSVPELRPSRKRWWGALAAVAVAGGVGVVVVRPHALARWLPAHNAAPPITSVSSALVVAASVESATPSAHATAVTSASASAKTTHKGAPSAHPSSAVKRARY